MVIPFQHALEWFLEFWSMLPFWLTSLINFILGFNLITAVIKILYDM